jgi:hypothetical protein
MALDPSILAKMKASKNKYSRGGNTVKIKEGKTKIRLLQHGTDQFWKEIGVHWIKTEKEGKPVAVVGCHDEVYGKPCAVCAAIDKSVASGTDEEKAIMKDWRAKKSVLVHALIRTGADASEEPQILEITGTTWSKISGTIEEYAGEGQDILDPNNGIDLIIERTGKGLNTEYSVMVAPGVSKPVPKGVVDRLPSFDEYVEKELFRGDERKALTAISNFSGIAVGGLTAISGPSSTTKMLTSSTVEDAVIEETPAAAAPAVDPELAKVAEELVAEEAPVETDEEREERELLERMAALKAKKAAAAKAAAAPAATKPAAAKPAAAPAPKKDDAFTADVSQDDIDAMLAELDG